MRRYPNPCRSPPPIWGMALVGEAIILCLARDVNCAWRLKFRRSESP